MKRRTARAESCQPGGRGCVSASLSRPSSSAKRTSTGARKASPCMISPCPPTDSSEPGLLSPLGIESGAGGGDLVIVVPAFAEKHRWNAAERQRLALFPSLAAHLAEGKSEESTGPVLLG